MKIQLSNVLVSIKDASLSIEDIAGRKLNLKATQLNEVILVKKSIDARNKSRIMIVYTLIVDVDLSLKDNVLNHKEASIYEYDKAILDYPKKSFIKQPIIIGFGPAGLFAALYLARCNLKPIVFERGSSMEDRTKEVKAFLEEKKLDVTSNVQFGEGGAGTFSDGKLTTNLKDSLINFILQEFVNHGAPKEILYESMPHIGTDFLSKTIVSIRKEIESLGGTVYFRHQFAGFVQDGKIIKAQIKNENEEILIYETNHLILGVGHSARDTITMLHENKLCLEPKSFSMGVRIEHKQSQINKAQYGEQADLLPPATYKLAVHLKERSVYTFCMCPGGMVMASASEDNTIVTNGMSYRNRDMENANSAILVNVDKEDYYKNSVLDGLYYQEKYEKLAFEIGKNHQAPANLVKEFLDNKVATEIRSITPSYPHGIVMADFNRCLPAYVVKAIREALPQFDRKIKGFATSDAVLIGVETRSSCPIRMVRDEDRNANIKGIYPIGEGAGYAGGIMSAALDGLKTAIKILDGVTTNEEKS